MPDPNSSAPAELAAANHRGEVHPTGRGRAGLWPGNDNSPSARGSSSRKRLHHETARQRSCNVRFSDDEYAALVAAANRSDLSPTAYVGTAALAAAAGTEAPGAPLREALTELMQARTAAVRIGVAVNKLAAKVLAGAEVSPGELRAAAAACSRSVARVEAAALRVHRAMA